MFISKSKKGFKPKAPARRGVEATVADDRSVETPPNSRNAEPARRVRGEEESNASGSQLAIAETEPMSDTRAEKQGNGRRTGKQTNAATTIAVPDTKHDEETSMRTRSGRRGARNAIKPASKISVSTVRGSSNTPVEATTAPPAEPVESAALPTPSPSQATAGGFIRKSKRSIAPRAPTRRRVAATEASSEADQNRVEAAAGATTTSSTFVSDQAETEDVARRLVAALGNYGSLTTANLETPTTRTGSSSRNAIVIEPAEQDNNDTSNIGETAKPSRTRKRRASTQGASRKRKQPIIEIEDTPAPDEQTIIKKSKAKSRTASVKPTTTLEIQPSVEANDNIQQGTPNVVQRKRKRPSTPEDAEARRIEATEVRMEELITDMHQGQVSQREKLLRQRDTAAKARRLEKAQAQARGELQEMMGEESTENQPEPESTHTNQLPPTSSQSIAVAAPQFRVVNGQVVSDEGSRVLDRRAERVLAAEAIDTTVEVIEEDDLSRRINGRSFTKYDNPTRWSPAATALFHKGLQYFGLEFSMMACLFPGRSRRQLKAKFIREERADVNLVNALLRDRQPVPSREELEVMMGKKLADPKELQEELRVQKEALEEAQRLEDQRNEERRLQRERGAEEEGKRVRSTGDNSDEDAGDGNGNDASGDDGNAAEAEMQARQLGENQDEDTNEANEENNDGEE